MTWNLVRQLKDRLKKEKGYCLYPAGGRIPFALAYPNRYRVGMSNLGLHVVYDLLNKRSDTACERCFLPEGEVLAEYRRTNTPLMTLESQTPLYNFPLLGFVLSFELDYFNLLTILELGRIKPLAEERGEADPLVIAGGPCATFNPEPMAAFLDALIIGEGEVVMPAFMDAYRAAKKNGANRRELLAALAQVPGVYVPSLYEHIYGPEGKLTAIRPKANAPGKVRRQWAQNLDDCPAHTAVVPEDAEFNLYLIEVARGCGRHCRFCMAGYAFRPPRHRSLGMLQEEAAKAKIHGKRLGLMGAAVSDYPAIDELCDFILSDGQQMSVASFRADSVTENLVRALAQGRLKTLTLAPEAGSEKLRAVINKGITEEHLFKALDLGLRAGIKNYRLYIMIGLPWEDDEDIFAIVDLTRRLKEKMGRGELTLSVNPFVPKPVTPFQWLPMADKGAVEKRLRLLGREIKKIPGTHIIAESVKAAYVQGILARGDRRLGKVLLVAQRFGGVKGFFKALKEEKLAAEGYLYREWGREDIFPWDIIDIGVTKDYLYSELEGAEKLQTTPPCFTPCRRCGVCR